MMNRIALEYINTVSLGLSLISKADAERRLAQLGIRLHFIRLPDGWIQALHPADLTSTWQNAGLPVSGVGYSTIGALGEDGRSSTRFWPTSPFYQAWLGAYLFQAPGDYGWQANGEPELTALMQPVLVNQRAWLHHYGCPEPQASLKQGSFHLVDKCTHQDFPAFLFEGIIVTQSDIGAGNRYSNGYLLYRVYELMFQRFGGVKLPPLCTLPPVWPIPSYHPLELEAAGLLLRLDSRSQWILFYFCAAARDGIQAAAQIKTDALAALRNARLVSN